MPSLPPIPNTPLRDDPNQDAIWKRWLRMLKQSYAGLGTVTGPSSSTDNAVPRFNGTDGIVLQNSGVIIDDSNNVTGVASITATSITDSGLTSGRVALVGTAGLLTDDSGLTFNTTTDILTVSGGVTISAGQLLQTSATNLQNGTFTNSAAAGSGRVLLYQSSAATARNFYDILINCRNAGNTADVQMADIIFTAVDPTGGSEDCFITFAAQINGSLTQQLVIAAGQGRFPVTGSGAGILIGGDAQLYRSAADILRTPDSLTVDVNLVVSGTAAVTGNSTLTGDLAVNGGDLTSSATTFNLLNATVTTLNLAGAGTTINIGAASGSVAIKNPTLTVGNAAFAGSMPDVQSINTDNTNAASHARFIATVGGASAGDPHITFNINGIMAWHAGADNSDSDAFSIGASTTVGSAQVLRLANGGGGTVFGAAAGVAPPTLTVSDASNTGVGANILLAGDGGTTPNKYIRAAAGAFQVANNAYSRVLLDITDAGVNSGGAGDSGSTFPFVSKASVNTTAVGNVGTGEDNLITYSLPASAMNAAGRGVRIKAWGTVANTAALKTLRCYFGSTAMITNALATLAANVWVIEALVFSTGTDTQDYLASVNLATTGATVPAVGTSAQDDGATIVIKCTGDATNNNDIVQEGLLVEFLN